MRNCEMLLQCMAGAFVVIYVSGQWTLFDIEHYLTLDIIPLNVNTVFFSQLTVWVNQSLCFINRSEHVYVHVTGRGVGVVPYSTALESRNLASENV